MDDIFMPNWRACTGSSIIQAKLHLRPHDRLLSFVYATSKRRNAALNFVLMSSFVAFCTCNVYGFDYNRCYSIMFYCIDISECMQCLFCCITYSITGAIKFYCVTIFACMQFCGIAWLQPWQFCWFSDASKQCNKTTPVLLKPVNPHVLQMSDAWKPMEACFRH